MTDTLTDLLGELPPEVEEYEGYVTQYAPLEREHVWLSAQLADAALLALARLVEEVREDAQYAGHTAREWHDQWLVADKDCDQAEARCREQEADLAVAERIKCMQVAALHAEVKRLTWMLQAVCDDFAKATASPAKAGDCGFLFDHDNRE